MPRRTARRPPGTSAMPLRTSLAVPSPPAAMMVWKPSRTAWAARRRASPGAEVARKTHWPPGMSGWERKRLARPPWAEGLKMRQGVAAGFKGIADCGLRIADCGLRIDWGLGLRAAGLTTRSESSEGNGGSGAESHGQLAGNLFYFGHLLRGLRRQVHGGGGNPGQAEPRPVRPARVGG
jgi:hypothetical protein